MTLGGILYPATIRCRQSDDAHALLVLFTANIDILADVRITLGGGGRRADRSRSRRAARARPPRGRCEAVLMLPRLGQYTYSRVHLIASPLSH